MPAAVVTEVAPSAGVAMGFASESAAAAALGDAVVVAPEAEVVPPTAASPMEYPHWAAVALNWTNYPRLAVAGSGDRQCLVSVRSFSTC